MGFKGAKIEKTANVIILKTDSFGLGFDPYAQNPELKLSSLNKSRRDQPVEGKKEGGFGIGVFEVEDDLEIYDHATAPSQNYDIELNEEEQIFKKPIKIINSADHYIPGFLKTKKILPLPKTWEYPTPPKDYDLESKQRPAISKNYSIPASINEHTDEQLIGNNEPNKQSNVFSMISLKAQAQIHKALEKQILTKEQTSKKPIPKVSKEIADAALSGFMPFAENPEKQTRYKNYLLFQAGQLTEMPPPPPNLKREDIEHEYLEFSKAAVIYRPLSKMMASRFTSSSMTDAEEATCKFEPKRITGTWKPDRITCKRFGVAYVKPTEEEEEDLEKKLAVNPDTMMKLIEERDRMLNVDDGNGDNQGGEEESGDEKNKIEEEVETIERPSMDLFKAIFCDSEEEEVVGSKVDVTEKKESAFRPIFSNNIKNKKNGLGNAGSKGEKRKSAVKLDSLQEFEDDGDDEVAFVKKRVRPSAADFM